MAEIQLEALCMLRSELAQLKQEREAWIRIAGAALVLVNDMDEDTFETFEAAELMAQYIQNLPETLLDAAQNFAYR